MKVLACTDGSKFSEESLEWGGKVLKESASEATVLYVESPLPKRYRSYTTERGIHGFPREELEALGFIRPGRRILDRSRKVLKEAGITKVRTKSREGDAAEEILKEAEEGAYDLLLMGSHGIGLAKFLLGSVSNKVVQNAKTPVLLVKKNIGIQKSRP